MASEAPPTYNTTVFNQSYWDAGQAGTIDTSYLNAHYLKFPTSQTYTETVYNLATTTDATINTLTVGLGNGSVATNTAVGYQSLTANTTGSLNTSIGYQANQSNTTGIENTALGSGALFTNITGNQLTAIGHESLYAATAGTQTAIGFHSARNSTGTDNLAIGYRALRGTAGTNTGANNVAIGTDSLLGITNGVRNIGVGYQSLLSTTASVSSIAIGYTSLYANTTGSYNIGIGSETLRLNTTGSNNVAIGNTTLYNTTGGNNTAVGFQAGTAGTANTTGTNNTYIGYQAQANANNYSTSTALGSGAIITASNQVVLGTTNETVRYNKLSPLYTTLPTFASTDVGYLVSSTSTTNPTTSFANLSSVSLTAGVWIINALVNTTVSLTTIYTQISLSSISLNRNLTNEIQPATQTNSSSVGSLTVVFPISSTTTIYLVGRLSAGTASGTSNYIFATRMA